MSFTRTTTVDASPTGDSVKQAVLDVDTDLTNAFTHLNTLDSNKVDKTSNATDAETKTGTATNKYLTPANAALLWGHGECRLELVSTNLVLKRIGLGRIIINGKMYQIPVAGVSRDATGATVGLTYYIYLYDNSGTLTLEFSTTGHSQDTTTGVEIKTGDATRTLVGMARSVTGPAWQDTTNGRFVISYFNRRNIVAYAPLTAVRSTASPSFANIASVAGEYAYFLTWGDDPVMISASAAARNTTAGEDVVFGIMLEGTTVLSGMATQANHPTASKWMNLSVPDFPWTLTEGFHFASPAGLVAAGAIEVYGHASNQQRAVVRAAIKG